MKQSSFTLAELTMVVFIIALLTAILAPVLRMSRQKAKAVLCNSNIKQLTLGLLLYDTEKRGLPYGFYTEPNMPPPPGDYAGFMHDRKGWWWFNFIKGLYKKTDMKTTIVECPSKYLTNAKLKNDVLCGNYGVNYSVCKSSDDRPLWREEFVGTPLNINQIPNPGKTLLIADSGYAMISWWQVTDNPPVVLGNNVIEDTAYIPRSENQ